MAKLTLPVLDVTAAALPLGPKHLGAILPDRVAASVATLAGLKDPEDCEQVRDWLRLLLECPRTPIPGWEEHVARVTTPHGRKYVLIVYEEAGEHRLAFLHWWEWTLTQGEAELLTFKTTAKDMLQ